MPGNEKSSRGCEEDFHAGLRLKDKFVSEIGVLISGRSWALLS